MGEYCAADLTWEEARWNKGGVLRSRDGRGSPYSAVSHACSSWPWYGKLLGGKQAVDIWLLIWPG